MKIKFRKLVSLILCFFKLNSPLNICFKSYVLSSNKMELFSVEIVNE